ncbi:cysteine proteinase inhibitor 8-like [Curcuma longa]|uniref:cysteine proteinase inhibitor 8-like n=1 Tax=Curcuma longa TaxID=136217 RepID=UPI003D9E3486
MIRMTPLMRPSPLLLFLLFFVVPTAAREITDTSPSRRIRTHRLHGGWRPIEDVEDSHVREIGEFAVEEHNRREHGELTFDKVVRGERQVVAGSNYRLVLRARDAGGSPADYQALVYERAWTNTRQLNSFVPIES